MVATDMRLFLSQTCMQDSRKIAIDAVLLKIKDRDK